MDNTCDTQTIRTIHRQYVRYTGNTCDTQAIREIRRQYISTRTRCSVFSHTGICKHVLAANHCKEKRRPEAERRQSLNMKGLAKPLYVAKGPKEKGRKRGGASGYRMKTAALIPQLAVGKSIGCRGHTKKTNKPAKTINKAASKSKATKSKATKSKATKSKATVSSKSKASKSKPKPKAATPTKTKASKAPAPLRPMGQYADGSTRFIQERKKRRIQDSDDDSSEDEEPDLPNYPF